MIARTDVSQALNYFAEDHLILVHIPYQKRCSSSAFPPKNEFHVQIK